MIAQELKDRSKNFAHRCVRLSLTFKNDQLSNNLRGQLIRCSTSVAANYRATCLSMSEKSFVSKKSIVIEEANESNFWLDFALTEKLSTKAEETRLNIQESNELAAIFIASLKTMQSKLNGNQQNRQ